MAGTSHPRGKPPHLSTAPRKKSRSEERAETAKFGEHESWKRERGKRQKKEKRESKERERKKPIGNGRKSYRG